jgi:division protein CdvB (Snf7/Vps24/ESCRT-III family)
LSVSQSLRGLHNLEDLQDNFIDDLDALEIEESTDLSFKGIFESDTKKIKSVQYGFDENLDQNNACVSIWVIPILKQHQTIKAMQKAKLVPRYL